jgi:hypothetical protein
MKRIIIIATLLWLILTPSAYAQDATSPNPSITNGVSILIGFAISYVVHWLKGFSFVNNNPKKVAAILSAVGSILAGVLGAKAGIGVWPIVIAFIIQLATSIGTFETVIKTTAKE